LLTRLLLGMGLALIGLLAQAPAAHADTTDDKFLAALEEQGIIDQASAAHAIEAAHFICDRLDTGESPADVMQDVLRSSNLPEFHTGFFVAQSIYAYCPQHKDEIPRG
jgi:hypothetical protein